MTYGHRSVAVVGARRRVDATVPADVPVAELLPELLDLAGEPAADGDWQLCRLGGRPLDAAATLAGLRVRDGELLHLVARTARFDPPVVGGVEDALARRARSAPRWSPDDGALLLGAVAAVAVAGSVVVALPVGWPDRLAPAAVGAVLWLLVAATLARRGRRRLGLLLGPAALPLGALAGVAAAASAVGDAPLRLVAGAAVGLVVTAVALGVAVPPRYGQLATAVAIGVAVAALPVAAVGAGTELLGAPVRAAAGALALAWLTVLAVAPRLSVGVGRLATAPAPVPSSAVRGARGRTRVAARGVRPPDPWDAPPLIGPAERAEAAPDDPRSPADERRVTYGPWPAPGGEPPAATWSATGRPGGAGTAAWAAPGEPRHRLGLAAPRPHPATGGWVGAARPHDGAAEFGVWPASGATDTPPPAGGSEPVFEPGAAGSGVAGAPAWRGGDGRETGESVAYPGIVGPTAELTVRALVAVLVGAGLGLAGCWLVLAGGGALDRCVLVGSVLVALQRARGYRFRVHLLPALLTAAAGLSVLVGVGLAALPSPVARLAAVWAGALVLVLAGARPRPLTAPPLLRRAIEWGEAAALAALVLLVLVVLGVVAYVMRQVRLHRSARVESDAH